MLLRLLSVTAIALTLVLASGASAATISYGNKQNASIEFNNIQETATNPDPPLFVNGGNPSNIFLSGSTLVFDVDPSFFAETTLPGGVLVDSTLTLDIEIPNGSNLRIAEVILRESGDYNLSNNGEAQVTTNLEWRVTEVNFLPNLLALQQDTMTFSPPGSAGNGHYQTPDTGGQWNGILTADVDLLTLGATAIQIFTVNNELEAFSYDGGTNRIHKKQFEIEVVFVPEPGTALLLSLGLGGFAYLRRVRH